jgi:hypothetical protein
MGQPLHAVPIPTPFQRKTNEETQGWLEGLNRNCVGQPRPEDLVCGAAEDGGNMLTPGENELPNLKTLVFNDTPWVNHSTLSLFH